MRTDDTTVVDGSSPLPLSSASSTPPGYSSVGSTIRLSVRYTLADVARRPRNCLIGAVAVLLLISFVGAVLLGITKAPHVLLRLAELTVGEVDILLLEDSFINATALESRLVGVSGVRGAAPRWFSRVTGFAPREMGSREAVKQTQVNVLVIDSAHERDIGLGRAWRHRDTGYAEAHVHSAVLDYIKVRPNHGERLGLTVPLEMIFAKLDDVPQIRRPTTMKDLTSFYLMQFFLSNHITKNKISITDAITSQFLVHVVDAVDGSNGKFPSDVGNIVVMDYKKIVAAMAESSCASGISSIIPVKGLKLPTTPDVFGIDNLMRSVDMRSHAMLLAIVLQNRRQLYKPSDNAAGLTDVSGSVMRAIGLDYPGFVHFPLFEAVQELEMFRSILVSILVSVSVGIVVLGGIVLTALLETNADERQLELALMRALGFTKRCVVSLLVTQSLAFLLPSLLIGAVALFGINVALEYALIAFTHDEAQSTVIPWIPYVIALLLGVILPTLATWTPVSRALNSSLRDAMDVYRQTQSEVRVVMIRLEELGLATWQVTLGIFLVVLGFIVYYMIPFSFIFQNLPLFFTLLSIILIVMVSGLCLIMLVAEPCIESFFLWLMLWGSEKHLKTLVSKNLEDHRRRNSKAFMMFLLSTTSVISGGVIFALLGETSKQMAQISGGADVTIRSLSFRFPLNVETLDTFLKERRGVEVEEWAYRSFALHFYPQIVSHTHLGTIIGTGDDMPIVAVSPTYLRTVYPDFVLDSARDARYKYSETPDGIPDFVRSMYDHPPAAAFSGKYRMVATGFPPGRELPNVSAKLSITVPAILPTVIGDTFGVEVGHGVLLKYKYRTSQDVATTTFYVQPRALMNRLSGFPSMSSMQVGNLPAGPVIIPETFFKILLNPVNIDFGEKNVRIAHHAITEVFQRVLYIRLCKGITARNRRSLVNILRAQSNMDHHIVVDTHEILEELQIVEKFINCLFYFTALVCISLCTLMMWITFVANVRLNAWTLGVLRAIGFRKSQILRCILYEAFSIVLSAFSLGIIVGIAVSVALGLQLTSLFSLPFVLPLPYKLIGVLFGLAVVSALIGSLLSFRVIGKKSIVRTLKQL